MSGNKMKIIELALKRKPNSYKSFNSLMTLARNLQVDKDYGDTLEFATLNHALKAAFEVSEMRC